MKMLHDAMFNESIRPRFDQEVKPLKEIDIDIEAQRFEETLRSNQMGLIERSGSVIMDSNLENAFFEKVSEIKKSIDTKLHEVQKILDNAEILDFGELLKAQCQIGMFTLEVTVLSNGSKKVSDGITTLFQAR